MTKLFHVTRNLQCLVAAPKNHHRRADLFSPTSVRHFCHQAFTQKLASRCPCWCAVCPQSGEKTNFGQSLLGDVGRIAICYSATQTGTAPRFGPGFIYTGRGGLEARTSEGAKRKGSETCAGQVHSAKTCNKILVTAPNCQLRSRRRHLEFLRQTLSLSRQTRRRTHLHQDAPRVFELLTCRNERIRAALLGSTATRTLTVLSRVPAVRSQGYRPHPAHDLT